MKELVLGIYQLTRRLQKSTMMLNLMVFVQDWFLYTGGSGRQSPHLGTHAQRQNLQSVAHFAGKGLLLTPGFKATTEGIL
jgi:hypothetical protein